MPTKRINVMKANEARLQKTKAEWQKEWQKESSLAVAVALACVLNQRKGETKSEHLTRRTMTSH